MDFTFDTPKFNKQLADFADRISTTEASKMIRTVSFDILRLLVKATPVGNTDLWKDQRNIPEGYSGGFARSNWYVTAASAYEGEPEQEIDPSEDGAVTLATGMAAIKIGADNLQAIWITNNVDYIEDLNAGHSTQAPAGFFEAAIETVDQRGR